MNCRVTSTERLHTNFLYSFFTIPTIYRQPLNCLTHIVDAMQWQGWLKFVLDQSISVKVLVFICCWCMYALLSEVAVYSLSTSLNARNFSMISKLRIMFCIFWNDHWFANITFYCVDIYDAFWNGISRKQSLTLRQYCTFLVWYVLFYSTNSKWCIS